MSSETECELQGKLSSRREGAFNVETFACPLAAQVARRRHEALARESVAARERLEAEAEALRATLRTERVSRSRSETALLERTRDLRDLRAAVDAKDRALATKDDLLALAAGEAAAERRRNAPRSVLARAHARVGTARCERRTADGR